MSRADQRYHEEKDKAELLLRQIKAELDSHAAQQAKQPTDYGYVGDVATVVQRLDEIACFLKGAFK